MADVFALLRAGTTFDKKQKGTASVAQNGTAISKAKPINELPPELDFFGEAPKVQKPQEQTAPSTEPSKKRKGQFEDIEEVDLKQVRKRLRINVTGDNAPAPITSFEDISALGAQEYLISNIAELDFSTPTPIQMQTIPTILAKRDLLACSPTGSGKTLAYLIPLLMRLDSHRSKGFRAVIIAPTRELAQQVQKFLID